MAFAVSGYESVDVALDGSDSVHGLVWLCHFEVCVVLVNNLARTFV